MSSLPYRHGIGDQGGLFHRVYERYRKSTPMDTGNSVHVNLKGLMTIPSSLP